LALETPEQQIELAQKIMRQRLSVRETETLVARAPERLPSEDSLPSPERERAARPDLFISALEEDLIRALGTKVRLQPRKKGGRIEIEYYSNEELEGLVRRLKGP
jgi:ParB family chromosome partitioning protein